VLELGGKGSRHRPLTCFVDPQILMEIRAPKAIT